MANAHKNKRFPKRSIGVKKIKILSLLAYVFVPTIVLSLSYLLIGLYVKIPNILLFCLLGTVTLVPMELGVILHAGKKEYGTYSLKSAFCRQSKLPLRKILIYAIVLFGITGLLSLLIAPVENQIYAGVRESLLQKLPAGFDWTNFAYVKAFSKPMKIFTCIYYGVFNVLVAPVTEELYFRGYLTSHYHKQNNFTPILIVVLFSLYHFWLPFNNIFRIFAFAPIAYVAYRKKNIFISIGAHCLCNLFSTVSFSLTILG